MSDKLRNFIVRTLSGAVLLLVILLAMWVGYYGYLALLLLITVGGVWEFYTLSKVKGYEPQRGLGVAMAVALYLAGAMLSATLSDCNNNLAANGTFALVGICLFVAAIFMAAIAFFADDKITYITKRFDYTLDGAKIAQEDFASLAGKTEKSHGKDFKYTGSYEDAALLLRQFVAAWRVEIANYFILIISALNTVGSVIKT